MFNPLAWGILFFIFWLTLQTIGQLNDLQYIVSVLSLALTVILLVIFLSSAFTSRLIDFVKKPNVIRIFLPIVFNATVITYTFSWLDSLPKLQGNDLIIGICVGFSWMLVYGMIVVNAAMRPLGILAAISMIGIGSYFIISSHGMSSQNNVGWALIAVGIILFPIALIKIKRWSDIPF